MKQLLIFIVCFSFFVITGCVTSQKSIELQEEKSIQSVPDTNKVVIISEIKKEEPIDTVNAVDIQTTSKPNYNPEVTMNTSQVSISAGNFSVQIGAYETEESAKRCAYLAKERFKEEVIIMLAQLNNLYKVLIGKFSTKDEARKFRDEINQKFPTEYKDAWVTEITTK